MLKNIYAPLSNLKAQEKLIDILANNLANVNTTAFKGDEVSFSAIESDPWPSYHKPLPDTPFDRKRLNLFPFKGNEMGYHGIAHVYRDSSSGPLLLTNRSLDVAIQGKGYLTVQDDQGREGLTRAGHFVLDQNGLLLTPEGYRVQGESGLIQLQGEENLQITEKGEIWQGDQFLDRFVFFQPDEEWALERRGKNLFRYEGVPEQLRMAQPIVKQGYLEGSNVNPVQNLVKLIAAQRQYESALQASKTQDETLSISSKQISQLRV